MDGKTLVIMEEEAQEENTNITTIAAAGLFVRIATTFVQAVVDKYLWRRFYQ